MCGILASINFVNTEHQNRFKEALELLSHRGPDDIGFESFHNTLLGHTRLSIQDLSDAGHQPMYSENKDIALIFNGEIYNFLEIKEKLIKKGVCFATQTDTEVILQSYIAHGIDCINEFIGMFAIVLVDKRPSVNKTYVIRDRLGIKPLYFFQNGNNFIFSSEVKSILKLANQKFTLNKRTVSSYFGFRYSILDETFFEGINNLTPGTYLELTENDVTEHRYWNLADHIDQSEDLGEEFYINRVRELMISAVKYRMISDVPFGAYLSGGVDSSLVTAIMSEHTDKPLKTFTIGFDEKGYNEFEYAQEVADMYNTSHTAITLNADGYFESLNELINFKDSPLSVPNEIPLYLMSKELKKHITVVLSGEGADEIFGGYGRIFRSADDYENQVSLNQDSISSKAFKNKYGCNRFESELDHFITNYSYTKPNLKSKILSKNIDWNPIEESLKTRFYKAFSEVDDASYQTKMMYTFETVHLQGLLARVDTTTMATAVEARVPFVDHRLVEFAFTIPNKYKLKWNSKDDEIEAKTKLSDAISEINDTPKYVLKKAAEHYLPHSVLYRKKMGFPVPLDKWFSGDFSELVKAALAYKENKAHHVIDSDFVLSLLENGNLSNDHSLAMKIWMVLNLFVFCEQYEDYLI